MASELPEWVLLVAQSLLRAVQEKDPYTYGHCRRVARNAKLLAKAAGLKEEEQAMIEFGSLFHDLGKMGIPDSILLKEGRLNPKEEAIMRAHPAKSVEIIHPLTQHPFFKSTVPGILHHHERIDGRGYPDGIQGNLIPLAARIILIADTFDAMTTTRPYRKALSVERTYKELMLFAGRQFDEHLVKIFLKAHPKWTHYEEDITEEFVAARAKKRAA